MEEPLLLNNKNTPPIQGQEARNETVKKPRSSNIELYRIICMMMIVAHHYVVNSGLTSEGGPLTADFTSGKSIFLTLFGAWGKTGINCFLMITGFFMCTSKITLRKFIKLMGQIYLYKLLLYPILLTAGYETCSPLRIVKILMPTWGVTDGFVGCFICFWLTIPFLNVLVQNMTKRQHEWLLILVLGMYTLLGSIPTFKITFNYVTWFSIIYFIASYIRLYPNPVFERRNLWGWMTLANVSLSVASIMLQRLIFGERSGMGYFFVTDSNKIFAVSVAVCSFLWFKNIDIKYRRIINAFGAGTFGVLLIHANGNAMKTWLWRDTVDVVGHYASFSLGEVVLYSVGVVLAIFIICNLIDQLRIAFLEKCFLGWYDRKVSAKTETIIAKNI